MNTTNLFNAFALTLSVSLAVGCAKKDEKVATQAAAKVNAEEITVHQINNVLARTPNIPPDALETTKREILEKLIDQEVAKQAAIEKKLDRSPTVMQTIESARSEILARAYVESIATAVPKPTPDEIKKYYADHPELFAERRIFNLQELTVPSTEGIGTKLQEQVAKSRSLEDVATWLTAQNIKFTASRGVRAAEAIPLKLLADLQATRTGEMKVIPAGAGVSIFRVVAVQAAPVNETAAAPRIAQFLFNQRASEATLADMKKLREKTKITMLGEFTETSAQVAEKTKAKKQAEAKELEKAKTNAELEAKARADAKAKIDAEAQANAEALVKARNERLAAEASAKDKSGDAKTKDSTPIAQQPREENIEKGLRGLR
jgi:EpsD family peptidyl-prolyl cis-trans isomerase